MSEENIAKVSIVGVGMKNNAGVAAKMFEAMAAENINILMISTSEIKISCVIDDKYGELAVRVLHDAFGLESRRRRKNNFVRGEPCVRPPLQGEYKAPLRGTHAPGKNLRHHPERRHPGRILHPVPGRQDPHCQEAGASGYPLHRRRLARLQPQGQDFFDEIRQYDFNGSRIAAFGSTHHKDRPPESDPVFQELLLSRAQVITIFGKSSLFQVKEILQTTPERNLELISDSLGYLKPRVEELFYDAEHFFDGFKEDRDYALKTLERGLQGGAQFLVLCDTNGGTLTSRAGRDRQSGAKSSSASAPGHPRPQRLGAGRGQLLAAVELGCSQVQGTINGFGERCGNANLCSIIPTLQLKMGIECISDEQLKKLTEISRFVYELANVRPNRYQPYVGKSAFAHKGGIHAAAVKRNPKAYEHINPALVGNARHIPVSDLSGRGSIFLKAKELGLELGPTMPRCARPWTS